MRIKIGFPRLITLLLLLMSSTAAFAGQTGATKIVGLENGWFGEGLVITATASTPGCGSYPNDYGVDASHPNFDTIVAMVLSAFLAEANVVLITDDTGCAFANRKKILAIRLIK